MLGKLEEAQGYRQSCKETLQWSLFNAQHWLWLKQKKQKPDARWILQVCRQQRTGTNKFTTISTAF